MKFCSSLRCVDNLIGGAFLLMQVPIFIALARAAQVTQANTAGLQLEDHLNYFADTLAVLAALYAGRTVFFSLSKPAAGAATDRLPGQVDREDGDMAETGEQDEPASIAESRIAELEHPARRAEPAASVETPQQVFGVMAAFLIAYALIKASTYLDKIWDFQESVLLYLMFFCAGSFAAVAFTRALNEGRLVGVRVLVALAFGIASIAAAFYAWRP